jgi:hypothetical protein
MRPEEAAGSPWSPSCLGRTRFFGQRLLFPTSAQGGTMLSSAWLMTILNPDPLIVSMVLSTTSLLVFLFVPPKTPGVKQNMEFLLIEVP